jgi:hypothetical protein
MAEFQGKRREDGVWDLKPGEYSKHICQSNEFPGKNFTCWLVYPPVPPGPVMIGPKPFGGWEVDENEDGTITLESKPGNSNSLLVHPIEHGKRGHLPGWHGYIDKGVWKG